TPTPIRLAAGAIAAGAIAELAGYASVRREVKYGKNSRVDFVLEAPARPPCYVEIKNVHLMRQAGLAEVPDAVTKRGAKHLAELGEMAAVGGRAGMLFLIPIGSTRRVQAARDLDIPLWRGLGCGARQGGRSPRLSLWDHVRRYRGGGAGADRRVMRAARLANEAPGSARPRESGDPEPRTAALDSRLRGNERPTVQLAAGLRPV